MKTVIYISRHAESVSYNSINNNVDILIQNMVTPLSLNGENQAMNLSKLDVLKDIDAIYSSNYARAIATAKYVAKDKKVNVDYRLSERIHGILKSYDELPNNFGDRQLEDENFKYGNGESRSEVASRMKDVLFDIAKKNIGKKIYIASHGAAISFLLMKVCQIDKKDDHIILSFNGKNIIDDSFSWDCEMPRMFEFVFDDDKIVNIRLIN